MHKETFLTISLYKKKIEIKSNKGTDLNAIFEGNEVTLGQHRLLIAGVLTACVGGFHSWLVTALNVNTSQDHYQCDCFVLLISQSMDIFLDMPDMFSYSVHLTYAINCRPLDCCISLADPKKYKHLIVFPFVINISRIVFC